MAHVDVVTDVTLDDPILIEGLPGQGLIGKLVIDHLLNVLDMEHYANVYCEGVPPLAAYRADDATARPAVQIVVDPDTDLLGLVSDTPVSPADAPEFTECITDFLSDQQATPIYISGFDGETRDEEVGPERKLYGLATGEGTRLLREAGVAPPDFAGIVTGPTGALINRASERHVDSVGLLVESTDALPDIDAARVVIDDGINPIVGVDIDLDPFVDRSIEMSQVAESVLDRMRDGSRAERTPTFY